MYTNDLPDDEDNFNAIIGILIQKLTALFSDYSKTIIDEISSKNLDLAFNEDFKLKSYWESSFFHTWTWIDLKNIRNVTSHKFEDIKRAIVIKTENKDKYKELNLTSMILTL
jgi:hypothetical protein